MVKNVDTLKSSPNVSPNADSSNNEKIDPCQSSNENGEKDTFFCKICPLDLPSWEALDDHLRTLHVVESSLKRLCESCQTEFHTLEDLVIHLRLYHTLEKIVSCCMCGSKLPCQNLGPISSKSYKTLKLYCDLCQRTCGKADKNCNSDKKITDNHTEAHFENENLIERSIFPQKQNEVGDIKIVSVVGGIEQPENGIDFENGSSTMIPGYHSIGFALNTENTSEKKIPNGSMKTITEEGRRLSENMKVLTGLNTDCNESLKEESTVTVTVSPQRDVIFSTQNTVLEKTVQQSESGYIDGVSESFLCKICCLSFSLFEELEGHLHRSHVVKDYYNPCGPNSCGSCKKGFYALVNVMKHLLNHHTEEKIYSCGECREKFPYPHSTTARRDLKFYCGRCQRIMNGGQTQTKNQTEKDKSENNIRVETTFSCEICQDVFSSDVALRQHQRFAHAVKPHVCQLCGNKYAFLNSLQRHSLIHNTKPGCDTSESQCSVKRESNHRRVKPSPKAKSYTCKICGQRYDKWISLEGHSKSHILKYSCDSCEKVFSNKNTLRSHQRQHRIQKPLSCDICKKKHKTGTCLNSSYHKQNNRYACVVCLRAFRRSSDLRFHCRIHTGDKPHACDSCEMKFSTRTALKSHAVTHSGEKPHTCEICRKGFARREHLKTHLRVHTGERPYVCDVCQKGFTQKWVMYTHRRIHTGERPFECDICQRGFIYKSQMKAHQLTHVKTELEN